MQTRNFEAARKDRCHWFMRRVPLRAWSVQQARRTQTRLNWGPEGVEPFTSGREMTMEVPPWPAGK